MKILFCAYDRPGHIATGPNAWIQRLIPDLIHRYKLDVTTLFLFNGKTKDCPTIEYFKKNNLPIKTISLRRTPYTEDQVKQILKIIKENSITVLIANLVIPAFYAAKYLNPFNIPVVLVFHSNDIFTKGVIKKFINNGDKGRITKSVSVSNYINNLIDLPLKSINHHVIPCGTPTTEYKACRNSPILKTIYAGRLVIEAKQVLELTHAFCKVAKVNSNFEFTIIGDGDQKKEVDRLVKSYDNPRVQLENALPPTEIIKRISEHHVFTLLSDYEGMPIALMEAMACGVVPVCYIGEGGIKEIIEDGVNGFILKDRSTDFINKLRILQENPELWQKMSQNAIKTIQDKYNTNITHRKWAELLLSFKNSNSQPITISSKIVLDGEPLIYSDFRKPPFLNRSIINVKEYWMRFRILVRPRARIRKVLLQLKQL